MKCAAHPDRDATGFCRTCGKPLCADCARTVRGVLYCESCLAAIISGPPAGAHAPSPGVAATLGFIPGLGAVYNGEYVKALIHVAIFAGIIAVLNSPQPDSIHAFFGIGLACFYFYMPIEAYRTARARQADAHAAAGLGTYRAGAAGAPAPAAPAQAAAPPAPSYAGPAAASFAGAPATDQSAPAVPAHDHHYHGSPAGAVLLIVIGVLILLANLGWLSGEWLGRWWPLIPIVIGVWLIWKRLRQPAQKRSEQP